MRADASVAIGTGHVMRSLTLAERLRAAGLAVGFGCRRFPGDVVDRIASHGFPVLQLGSANAGDASWLGVTLDEEIAAVQVALRAAGAAPRMVVVDHYELGERWERTIANGAAVFVIDDLADRPHAADFLLDQNVAAVGRYAGLVPGHARCFLGPAYALLRPQFAAVRRHVVPRERVQRILVFYGGIDASGETLKATRALRDVPGDVAIDIVAPPSVTCRDAVAEVAQGDARMTVHGYVEDMAQLVARADLALGAAGTASWERAFLGLPTIATTVAPNQLAVIAELARAGAAVDLGLAARVRAADLLRTVVGMMSAGAALREMSVRAAALFEGYDAAQESMYDAVLARLG